MKRRTIFLIIFLLGKTFQLFSQFPPIETLKQQPKNFPRLTFWITKDIVTSYFNDYEKYGKHWNGQPTLPVILNNMEKCFNEAVAYYEINKDKLPLCLKNCLDKLLMELKKPGPTILNCIWSKDKVVPWPFVYKQRFDLVEAEGNGMSTEKEYIYLINVWQNTYDYNKKPIMTSSILLHELIHCVKKNYPDCFKELGRPEEEGTTEDGTVMLYGKDNCCTGYKDRFGWDTKCTYENVCKCECAPKNFD